MFPIFWQGVWEPPVPGDDEERTKARQRWRTYTREMRPEAIAHLKWLQPPDTGGSNDRLDVLTVINRLSNTDRHSKLPVISTGLKHCQVRGATGNRFFLATSSGLMLVVTPTSRWRMAQHSMAFPKTPWTWR